jgi:hypothetical protein
MDSRASGQRLICIFLFGLTLAFVAAAPASAIGPGFTPAMTISSSIGSGDPTQVGRLERNGQQSTCETPNVVPTIDSNTRNYKAFPILSLINEGACLELETTAPLCTGTSFIQSAIYRPAFVAGEITVNLITAEGLSPNPSDTYFAAAPAGQTQILSVTTVTPGVGCSEFSVQINANRPWATGRPQVLAGETSASGALIPAGSAVNAGPATWSSAVTHAYQWQACDPSGNNCAAIAGATASSFTPGTPEVGHTLRVIDLATDPAIGKTSSSTSPTTGVVYPVSVSTAAVTALPVKPSNAAVLGRFLRNTKTGTGKLLVTVPGPGILNLAGKGVGKSTASAGKAGTVQLSVRATGKAKKRLKAKGKARVTAVVTFVPNGGDAATQSRKLLLKRIPPA